jgi:hypothetical protein
VGAHGGAGPLGCAVGAAAAPGAERGRRAARGRR